MVECIIVLRFERFLWCGRLGFTNLHLCAWQVITSLCTACMLPRTNSRGREPYLASLRTEGVDVSPASEVSKGVTVTESFSLCKVEVNHIIGALDFILIDIRVMSCKLALDTKGRTSFWLVRIFISLPSCMSDPR